MADARWVWAAYNNGKTAFEPTVFPPEMQKDDFTGLLQQIDEEFDLFTLEATVQGRGRIPVGLVALEVDGERLWPHLSWFWWASPRNKYEALFKFFLKYDEEGHFMVHVPEKSEAERICMHLSELKILRRIGSAYNWYHDGPGVLFEGKA